MRTTSVWLDVSLRTVIRSGVTYLSIIYWYAGPPTSDLTTTSNAQKAVLRDLLYDMTRTPPPESYRRYATTKTTYTIVERKEGKRNYRIDNQLKLDFSDPDSRLNIHYQIDGNSHAMVLVRMKPTKRPIGITTGLVDEDQVFGFSPGTVMGFIEKALKYSADNMCYTYINWTIEEIEHKSKYRSPDILDVLIRAAGKVGATVDTKVYRKIADKVAAKITAEVDNKIIERNNKIKIWKKIPGIGFLIGLGLGFRRLISGEPALAFSELVSGMASGIPGTGTATSAIIDAILLKHDRGGEPELDTEDLKSLNLDDL